MLLNKLVDENVISKENNTDFFQKKGFSPDITAKYSLGYLAHGLSVPEHIDSVPEGSDSNIMRCYQYLIPDYSEYGKINYVIVRRNDDAVREMGIPKPAKSIYIGDYNKSLWNERYLMETDSSKKILFINEVWTDALSLEELGYKAVALNRVANICTLREHFLKNKSRLSNTIFVAMCDQDEYGVSANKELKSLISGSGGKIYIFDKYPAGCKDSNEWLTAARDEFAACMRSFINKIMNDEGIIIE